MAAWQFVRKDFGFGILMLNWKIIEVTDWSIGRILLGNFFNLLKKAVEFYNERGNYKYKIYQKRMQMFLSKPKIE
jgi:hypothetical protein